MKIFPQGGFGKLPEFPQKKFRQISTLVFPSKSFHNPQGLWKDDTHLQHGSFKLFVFMWSMALVPAGGGTFLSLNKKVPKEVSLGEALSC